jgi:hypothetical protein
MNTMGLLHNKIINYLALNPDKSKTEIAEALGYTHPGYVNKQTNRLLDDKLIQVSSKYLERGGPRNRYSLTSKGISYRFEASDYSTIILTQTLKKNKSEKVLKLFSNILDTLDALGVSPDKIIDSYIRNNNPVFSGLKLSGNALHVLINIIVRSIWESPLDELTSSDSGDGQIYQLRDPDKKITQEIFDEDIFDWILREHIEDINDFDYFTCKSSRLFPLVFGKWDKLKKYGLDSWVKKNLPRVVTYTQIQNIAELYVGNRLRYSHMEFIDDLSVYLYGPFPFISDKVRRNLPFVELLQFLMNSSDVLEFVVKQSKKYKKYFEGQIREIELYEKNII